MIVMPELNRCGRDAPVLLTAESAMIIGAAMLIDNSELAAQSRTHNSALIEDGDGSHRVPGAVWDLGKTLAGHSLKARAGAA